MKLKDILTRPYSKIMVRTTLPDDFEGDTLFGYCAWDGETLISLDGDTYCLDDEVERFEIDENGMLIYWFKSVWLKPDKLNLINIRKE